MKKIACLLFLVSIVLTSLAQKTKAAVDHFTFNVAKGVVFENVTQPTIELVIVHSRRAEEIRLSKNITLQVPGSNTTFIVSNAQCNLLKDILQVTPVQIVVNRNHEMIGYTEIQ